MQVLMENLLTRFSSYLLQIEMHQRITVMMLYKSEARIFDEKKSKNNGILRMEALVYEFL